MYKTYFKTTLAHHELKAKNRYAPDGLKHCNGVCQDYREKSEFSGTKMICRDCMNLLNLAKKQIEEDRISLKEFKDNPQIVKDGEIVVGETRKCQVCNDVKTLNNFEAMKKSCKSCRSIQAVTRNYKDLDKTIQNIERLKEHLDQLKNYLVQVPKDKLTLIVKHYQVGRKSSDTKAVMVCKLVEHFRKFLHPTLCQGGCGSVLQKEFQFFL